MSKDKKRKIILVIEDVDLDKDTFAFTMQGDTDRMGSQEMGLVPTAAEQWGVELFKTCNERLKSGDNVKKLNREERRKG